MDADTKTIYEEIKEVAKNGDVVYYSEIAPSICLDMRLHKDRKRIGAILDCINRSERDKGRPLLSAVVVRKIQKMPGTGFFRLAKDIGLQVRGEDNFKFWLKELRRVHHHWCKIGTTHCQA